MKKITFLMLHLNFGGIEKQVTTLANSLVDRYDIQIISLYDILGGKSFYTLDPKIKVKYILPYGPNKDRLKEALKSFDIVKFVKECARAVKIIYSKYIKIGKIANKIDTDILISSRIEFAKQIKRDDIVTISQEHSYIDNKRYIKRVRESFTHMKYLVVMTKHAKKKYEDWLKDSRKKPEVIVIPNIIEESKGVSELSKKVLISVGRLEQVKRFDLLIDIFSVINKKHSEYILKIVGDGSKRFELEKKIEDLGLNDKVILTGKLNDDEVNKQMQNSTIFLLTSQSESFSLVLAEAMRAGLPCISFDVDVGPREIITDNIDGFLIKDNDVSGFANKVIELIEDRTLLENMGKCASKNVSRFYAKNIIQNWINIF